MSPSPSDRRPAPRPRLAFALVTAAGSVAWSPAGRGGVAQPGYRLAPEARIEAGDRALPIVFRN